MHCFKNASTRGISRLGLTLGVVRLAGNPESTIVARKEEVNRG